MSWGYLHDLGNLRLGCYRMILAVLMGSILVHQAGDVSCYETLRQMGRVPGRDPQEWALRRKR